MDAHIHSDVQGNYCNEDLFTKKAWREYTLQDYGCVYFAFLAEARI